MSHFGSMQLNIEIKRSHLFESTKNKFRVLRDVCDHSRQTFGIDCRTKNGCYETGEFSIEKAPTVHHVCQQSQSSEEFCDTRPDVY